MNTNITAQTSARSPQQVVNECAANPTSPELWAEFYGIYRRKLLTYLWRGNRICGASAQRFNDLAEDWIQEFFIRLFRDDARILRSFRGDTAYSLDTFLACVAVSVVIDSMRSQKTARRPVTVSLDDPAERVGSVAASHDSSPEVLFKVMDMEGTLRNDGRSKNVERDLMIFQLYFIEGYSAREIASMPSLELTKSGTENVIERLRTRLMEHSA